MKVLQKEYHAKKKQEKKSGSSGWLTQRWKQDLLVPRALKNNRTLPAC